MSTKRFAQLFDYLKAVETVNLFEAQQMEAVSLEDLEVGTPVRVAYKIHEDGSKEFEACTYFFIEYDELHGALVATTLDGDDPEFDDQFVTLGQLALANGF